MARHKPPTSAPAAPLQRAVPAMIPVDADGLLQVPDAATRISLSLPAGRTDVRYLPPMPRLQALRAAGSGLEVVGMVPDARHVMLDGCRNLFEVQAPSASHVHVGGCGALRTLQTSVPADAVPAFPDIHRRTWQLFLDREQRAADAEAEGNFKRHSTPRLIWPHMIVSAAGQVTMAVANMMRNISIETGAALLCIAGRPEHGVPDWWADYGPGDDGWINAMQEWAECR